MADYSNLVQALLQPQAYSHEGVIPHGVELVETHVSYLFLTGEHAYKVKKAVDLGFLDFTDLETRRRFCHEEVTVNQRFSPEVYQGVATVNRNGDSYSINGPGEVVEYAVKMRQLPREQMLEARLRSGDVSLADVERIAQRIAAFHDEAATTPGITRLGGLETVRHNVEENFTQTERFVGTLVEQDAYDDITTYSRAFMDVRKELFKQREATWRVRDCHGDIHAGQVCMIDGVEVIDCVEFNSLYLYSDVASDIAFLAMDLDRYERHDLSTALLEAYVQASGDAGILELTPFFQCYRAYVRAKVTGLKLETAALSDSEREAVRDEACSYYGLAHGYAMAALRQPALYVLCGLAGTGKSSIAGELARRWQLRLLSSDVKRKQLAGMALTEHHHEGFGEGIYSTSHDDQTYDLLLSEAATALKNNQSAVLDASFRKAEHRKAAVAAGAQAGADVWLIECTAAEDVVRERLERRAKDETAVSDATWPVYVEQKARWEPVAELTSSRHIVLDTGNGTDASTRRLIYEIFAHTIAA